MDKFGGYRNTNDNDNYKRRELTRSRAEDILAAITAKTRKGGAA
jgi:hypothetical protein